jgi:hypothetical protein
MRPVIIERRQTQKIRIVSDDQLFLSCRIQEQMSFWKSLIH